MENSLSSIESRGGHFFSISKQEIIGNEYDLSLSKYKQEIFEEVTYQKPKMIFEKLEGIEATISKGLKELKELI